MDEKDTPVDNGKLRDRVAALEKSVARLEKGCVKMAKEIRDEWSEETLPAGNYQGVELSYE